MIWIICFVVIFCVAPETRIRRVGIIAVVAACTFIGYGKVRAFNPVVIVMDREGCRFPVGLGGMAGCTIVWYADSHVVGIVSLVIVIGMAAGTGVGCSGIAIGMAIGAGSGSMRAGKRKRRFVVIKTSLR